MNAPLRFVFGLRSPYAWLAWRLLQRHLPPAQLARIELLPYWDPAPATLAALEEGGGRFLYRPMSRERHLYVLGDIKRLARRLDLPLAWALDPAVPDWELPHLACLAALRAGCGPEVIDALFAARWERGLDICDAAVLARLLAPYGLAPADDAARAAVGGAIAALREADRLGVFGLPFFAAGRERFWGVDRLPFALAQAGLEWRVLGQAWLEAAAPAVSASAAPSGARIGEAA
jgi:2-hydroxychromene-2-carboxylate isomerase